MLKKILITVSLLILGIAGSIYVYANYRARIEADQLVVKAMESGNYEAISYESVNVDLMNQELVLRDIRLVDKQQIEYILNEVVIYDYDYKNKIPHHVKISIKGVSLPRGLPDMQAANSPALESYLASILEEDNIPLTIDYHYNYDPDNNNQLSSEMGIGLENAANLTFSSTVRNVSLETLAATSQQRDPAMMQAQLLPLFLSAEIPHLSMQVEDLGIIDAVITIQAEQNGMSEDAFRQMLMANAGNLYMTAPPATQQFARDLNVELVNFLEGGKTFMLSIEPEFGGSIQQLQPQVMGAVFSGEYQVIIDLMNLSANTL